MIFGSCLLPWDEGGAVFAREEVSRKSVGLVRGEGRGRGVRGEYEITGELRLVPDASRYIDFTATLPTAARVWNTQFHGCPAVAVCSVTPLRCVPHRTLLLFLYRVL